MVNIIVGERALFQGTGRRPKTEAGSPSSETRETPYPLWGAQLKGSHILKGQGFRRLFSTWLVAFRKDGRLKVAAGKGIALMEEIIVPMSMCSLCSTNGCANGNVKHRGNHVP